MSDSETSEDKHAFDASNFIKKFKKYGTKAFTNINQSSFNHFWSFGFTGETYYDYDRPYDKKDTITIIHFNDVYNIETPPNECGGVSRFVSAIRQFSNDNPLIFFSGDAFNPSIISNFTKGRHMVPFLNILKIQTACVGNHDLDFGLDHLEYLAGSTHFPWLLSNVFDPNTSSSLLGGTARYHLFEWQGHRVGVIGLSTLLRNKECELIIALTHMRAVNDERLARQAKDLDIILGGHDHHYFGVKRIGNTIVAKSGTDFKEFSLIKISPNCNSSSLFQPINKDYFAPDNNLVVDNRERGAEFMPRFCNGSVVEWEHIQVTEDAFPRNKHIDRIVNKYVLHLKRDMETVIGRTCVPLETRFAVIRTQETNCGNWIADIMRQNAKSDIAFFNSGTIRSDQIIPPGQILVRDLVTMLPMPDTLEVIKLSKEMLYMVLEISVATYPSTEGRFLQISGFRFTFDASYPPFKRVTNVELYNDKDGLYSSIKDDETITANGKDGYYVLKDAEVILNEESFPPLATLVRNFFSLAAMASGKRKARTAATSRQVDKFQTIYENIFEFCHGEPCLNPKVEGRITILNPFTH